MDQWIGKVALVTGASAGIGDGIAERLALEGVIVVATARRADRLKELEKRVNPKCKNGGKIIPAACDVTKRDDIVALLRKIEKDLGGIHILINNAGTALNTKILDGEVDKWRWMFELNVLACGVTMAETVEIMKRKKINGHIINILSISGHGIPEGTGKHVYNGTKHALRLMTEGVRAELNEQKSKIKISMVSPGFVESEIFEVGGWSQLPKDLPMLKASDLATACVHVLATPSHMMVADYILRPVGETCPA